MAVSRKDRDYKKKMGQFMTPINLAKKFINRRNYKISDVVLEPSFGDGSFLLSIVDRFVEIYSPENINLFVVSLFKNNIYGVELDSKLYDKTLSQISIKYNIDFNSISHNLYNCDFFDVFFPIKFNYIEGNPPFGGSFDEEMGIKLDKIYGKYDGVKIKKETYSFFTHRCINLLKENGELGFICSDTFMTIPTMKGIRKMLMDNETYIETISDFSDETTYPMVYFNLKKSNNKLLFINQKHVPKNLIEITDTLSFLIDEEYAKYFSKDTLSKYITCSSGMTIGKNKLFLKPLKNGKILETLSYNIVTEVKTIEKEKIRARLGKISHNIINRINNKEVEDVLVVTNLENPVYLDIPNENYRPYNKASPDRYFSEPTTYIYWKNDGQAVYTYKNTGPWYLHGVGGKSFFNKEGFTWRLISNDIRCRYLPEGYILDSGSPVGVLKEGVSSDELYFIIGWLNTKLSTKILKTVINHTKNIQSKDVERMPYPYWVSEESKQFIVDRVKKIIKTKIKSDSDDVFMDSHFSFT
jgi:hypothetical protein